MQTTIDVPKRACVRMRTQNQSRVKQAPKGRPTIARGDGLKGRNPWNRIRTINQAPTGRQRINRSCAGVAEASPATPASRLVETSPGLVLLCSVAPLGLLDGYGILSRGSALSGLHPWLLSVAPSGLQNWRIPSLTLRALRGCHSQQVYILDGSARPSEYLRACHPMQWASFDLVVELS
jgi:hypothetical protein